MGSHGRREFGVVLSDEKDTAVKNAAIKIVKIAIREFAVPCPRSGSIDANSGYGEASSQGIEIHQLIQAKREKEDSDYQAEVKIAREFERGEYLFQVEGRMDGFFDHQTPKIEEIKSTFALTKLSVTLSENHFDHPYSLQLQTYGYFYYLDHGVVPELAFYLVSTRNRESEEMGIELDIEGYEAWLELRLEELVEQARLAEKRVARRKKISKSFAFPFEKPRSGQIELIETVEQGIKDNQRMLVQAPTGLGKTVGVLYPSLKEALSRGQRVVYVTPKNSQHTVAEDAIEQFQNTGSPVKSLTITAKSKMCFKAEPLCNPTYCEFARDYYTKVAQNDLLTELSKKKKLTRRTFKALGEKHEVCPFELQLEAVPEADTVICDYNYVFAPQSALRRLPPMSFAQEGKPNLVVDEAHNLPSRAMDYYSPSLSSVVLSYMREDIRKLPRRIGKEAEELLDECIQVINGNKPIGATRHTEVKLDLDEFVKMDVKLRGLLSKYLESDIEIQPKDVILKLTFYWGSFTDILQGITESERPEFFTTFQPHPTGGVVKITCCDASEMLKSAYDDFSQVVAFSATLKPFDYYAKLSGLKESNLKVAEFQSPFEKSNRKLLIIPQISTKYSDRERNYSRIAETITRISALMPGNYVAFFPSFDFLEKVLALFSLPAGFQIVKQERSMHANDSEAILEHLKTGAPTVVFAVQGGIFSEGVDYPGDMLVGAFVIGPPLPHFDVERETMRKYYDEHYEKGFDYAYAYPAMAKSVQAAGRVIRSEKDRGVIVLMDGRFLEASYTQSMPQDWFKESARELVSTSILKEVAEFWEKPV